MSRISCTSTRESLDESRTRSKTPSSGWCFYHIWVWNRSHIMEEYEILVHFKFQCIQKQLEKISTLAPSTDRCCLICLVDAELCTLRYLIFSNYLHMHVDASSARVIISIINYLIKCTSFIRCFLSLFFSLIQVLSAPFIRLAQNHWWNVGWCLLHVTNITGLIGMHDFHFQWHRGWV